MMRVTEFEWRDNLFAVDAIFICLGDRIVAGMEIGMCLFRCQDAHRRRQQPVDGLAQVVKRDRILEREGSHLSQRVYSGVGAAGTRHVYGSAFVAAPDGFEYALDSRKP